MDAKVAGLAFVFCLLLGLLFSYEPVGGFGGKGTLPDLLRLIWRSGGSDIWSVLQVTFLLTFTAGMSIFAAIGAIQVFPEREIAFYFITVTLGVLILAGVITQAFFKYLLKQ